jgi:hypothetical protein
MSKTVRTGVALVLAAGLLASCAGSATVTPTTDAVTTTTVPPLPTVADAVALIPSADELERMQIEYTPDPLYFDIRQTSERIHGPGAPAVYRRPGIIGGVTREFRARYADNNRSTLTVSVFLAASPMDIELFFVDLKDDVGRRLYLLDPQNVIPDQTRGIPDKAYVVQVPRRTYHTWAKCGGYLFRISTAWKGSVIQQTEFVMDMLLENLSRRNPPAFC